MRQIRSERVFETRALKGVFGAIRDASPDYWGRRVIEKYAGLSTLSELDYLTVGTLRADR